jgi:hypothetical protein
LLKHYLSHSIAIYEDSHIAGIIQIYIESTTFLRPMGLEACNGDGSMYSKEDIQAMLDSMDVSEMLKIMSQICYEKAEILRSDWQDIETARAWEKVGRAVGKIKIKTELY